jgi:hypothetical protein
MQLHRWISVRTAPRSSLSLPRQQLVPLGPSPSAEVLPTYFAYSGSGSVTAEVVYANYDHNEDYAYLASREVDVAGKVALVRYGDIHYENMAGGRGLRVCGGDCGARASGSREALARALDSRRMRRAGAGFAVGREAVEGGIFAGACG